MEQTADLGEHRRIRVALRIEPGFAFGTGRIFERTVEQAFDLAEPSFFLTRHSS
jgi:hypothetical protein